METLRVGVIGVGHLGALHAKMLSDMPGARLVGVFDVDQTRSAKIAGEYGVQSFATTGELLASVDAVTIASSTSTHCDVAGEALEHKKHVFIEKPITESTEDAGKLCRLAAEKNVQIQVGHIERFNPAILALEKYAINPLFVESHRLAQFNPRGTDVAVVLDLMIHDLDLILSFVKSPVQHIDANGIAVVSDSVDIANARVQFENGCVANVTASRISQRKMRKMRLFQTNAYISIDFSEGLAEVFRLVDEDEPGTKGTMMLGEIGSGKFKRKIVYEQPAVKEVNALKHELSLFVRAATDNSRPVVNGEDGKRALEVASIILQRIGEQKIVLNQPGVKTA